MYSLSRESTLTPCRSPTPDIPVQPDHFYGSENVQLPPSPDSDGKTWLDPADDPLANRGVPVFKPTMEEFQDFEGYMNKVECWGNRSGIVKIIPPKEWTASLPPLKEQLTDVKIKTPIEQHMRGSGGLFRQQNMEKRKLMSVREWVELCTKDEFRAPGLQEVGLSSRNLNPIVRSRPQRKGKQKAEAVKAEPSGPGSSAVVIKEEPTDDYQSLSDMRATQTVTTPPNSEGSPPAAAGPSNNKGGKKKKQPVKQEPKPRPKRVGQTREARVASLAERAARDSAFLDVFEPDKEWLPPSTKASDYTPEFCRELERRFWRNCGLGKPAWYGADTLGSLFTDDVTAWNVGHLPSALSRLLPSSDQGLPGVNTPYLYFGMWRATFAWHVEDMDLFSINYIHFGAPKFWYAIPQGRAPALEQTMRGYFPKDTSQCPQFLRHKSFLASPTILANSSCRPNHLVQQAGEFVITFPRGYHAGFNLGLNCAESVNFALESWLDVGRRAKVCECVGDSVRIDVDQLLREREEERNRPVMKHDSPGKRSKTSSSKKEFVKQEIVEAILPPPKAPSRKRKSDAKTETPKTKKIKITHSSSKLPSAATISIPAKAVPKLSVTLRLGPRPAEQEPFPCCLCVSMSKDGLLKVQDPPLTRKDAVDAAGNPKTWMAHEYCASIVPETWVDELDLHGVKEKVVFGVDGIVKDRWNLKCSACTKNKPKAHGAPVQCTKGKCPRAFHVNCANEGYDQGIVFAVERIVEKEVLLLDRAPLTTLPVCTPHDQMQVDPSVMTYPNAVAMDTAPGNRSSEGRVLKVIKKLEVQILCTQHNPAVAAQKKASKNNKIRNDLLALPPMTRIKIRVSSGVFEVSLIRVVEETSTVEVLWDRGVKREFKWGSVVFGSTDGPVLQKPSEPAPEVEMKRPPSALPVTTYPSVLAATSQQPYSMHHPGNSSATASEPPAVSTNSNTAANQQFAPQTQHMYPPRTGPYDYWTYAAASQFNGQMQHPSYPYGGYYPTQAAGGPQQYIPYNFNTQSYNSAQYRNSQLNWQQPYQGPPLAGPGPGPIEQSGSGSGQVPQIPQMAEQTPINHSYYRDDSQPTTTPGSSNSSNNVTPGQNLQDGQNGNSATTSTEPSSNNVNPQQLATPAPNQQKPIMDLSSLDAAQIVEMFRTNSQLRDMVLAAVGQSSMPNP
ncbi:hypothetical protein GALMADRAFT_259628 [Galerina marginata CBS 339.88]|uniref:[histone H3]-trimethyl-L-lysine(9) demethylase n=1 Tax=Galerina marginata (strain CBS 339.88) TaxID=685588 RepID=A0A067S8A9_GALM3|nr:hypothetical protein GALMADRAFT_259628 [Galerina marginata CBS 339.88]